MGVVIDARDKFALRRANGEKVRRRKVLDAIVQLAKDQPAVKAKVAELIKEEQERRKKT